MTTGQKIKGKSQQDKRKRVTTGQKIKGKSQQDKIKRVTTGQKIKGKSQQDKKTDKNWPELQNKGKHDKAGDKWTTYVKNVSSRGNRKKG